MKEILIFLLFVVSIYANNNTQCKNISNVYESIGCYEKENKALLLKLDDLNNSQTHDFKTWNLAIKQKCEKIKSDDASSLQGGGIGLLKLSCYNKAYKNRIKKFIPITSKTILPEKQPLYKIPQEQTNIFPKTIISDSFKKAYDNLKKTPNSLKAQEQYFIHFPSNFKIFSYLLGYYEKVHGEYSDNDLNGIYYEAVFENMNSGLDMVHIFFKLDKIHQDRVYNKIIDIYQNAYWQSDGFGIFMSAVKDMLERSDIRLEEFIEVLSKRSANEQKEFWRVYFDTPVPMRKLTPSLKKIETLNPNMYKIMYESVK